MTGTGILARLALRLDRVRLAVCVVVLAIMPAGTAAQYKQTYPTQQALDNVSGVLTNPSLVAINGPLFDLSLGGLTAWKIGVTELVRPPEKAGVAAGSAAAAPEADVKGALVLITPAADKAQLEITPVPGDEVQQLVAEIYKTSPEIVKKAAEILK